MTYLKALGLVALLCVIWGGYAFLVVVVRPWLKSRSERWLARKLGVPLLDCGCPDDGRTIYGCLYCGRSRCERHPSEHDCPAREVAS